MGLCCDLLVVGLVVSIRGFVLNSSLALVVVLLLSLGLGAGFLDLLFDFAVMWVLMWRGMFCLDFTVTFVG